MIYHVLKKEDWQKVLERGFYEAPSLATEGFIHASRLHQVAGVLERYFTKEEDLLVLHIDENKLLEPLAYVFSDTVNDEFPHIFGRLNLDTIIKVEAL